MIYGSFVRLSCDKFAIEFFVEEHSWPNSEFYAQVECVNWCVYADNPKYAYRANNFIVGLTNVSPLESRPTLWNYTLCGQYPGAVPAAATVSLCCQCNLPPFRYVIVQFPITNDYLTICELEVFAPGM